MLEKVVSFSVVLNSVEFHCLILDQSLKISSFQIEMIKLISVLQIFFAQEECNYIPQSSGERFHWCGDTVRAS